MVCVYLSTKKPLCRGSCFFCNPAFEFRTSPQALAEVTPGCPSLRSGSLPPTYTALIRANDTAGIMARLTGAPLRRRHHHRCPREELAVRGRCEMPFCGGTHKGPLKPPQWTPIETSILNSPLAFITWRAFDFTNLERFLRKGTNSGIPLQRCFIQSSVCQPAPPSGAHRMPRCRTHPSPRSPTASGYLTPSPIEFRSSLHRCVSPDSAQEERVLQRVEMKAAGGRPPGLCSTHHVMSWEVGPTAPTPHPEGVPRPHPPTHPPLLPIKGGRGGGLAALTTPAVRRPPPLGSLFGSDITTAGPRPEYKVQPAAIQALYRDYVIPLTKDVEVRAPQRGGGAWVGQPAGGPLSQPMPRPPVLFQHRVGRSSGAGRACPHGRPRRDRFPLQSISVNGSKRTGRARSDNAVCSRAPPPSAHRERPGPQTRRPVGPPQVAYLLQRVDHTAVAVAGEALDDSNPAVRAACQQFGAHIQVPNPSAPPSQVLDAFDCSESSRSHISPRVFLLPDVSGYPKPLSWDRGMTIRRPLPRPSAHHPRPPPPAAAPAGAGGAGGVPGGDAGRRPLRHPSHGGLCHRSAIPPRCPLLGRRHAPVQHSPVAGGGGR